MKANIYIGIHVLTSMELRMYKYRIYPSGKQKIRLINNFSHCKYVYNTLLDLNKKLWITNKYGLDSLIMDLKCCSPAISKEVHSQVLQNVSDRLSKSFDNFFRRVKDPTDKEKGFPRFKSRVNSIKSWKSFLFISGVFN